MRLRKVAHHQPFTDIRRTYGELNKSVRLSKPVKLGLGSLGVLVLLIAPAAAFNINNEPETDKPANMEAGSTESSSPVSEAADDLSLEVSAEEESSSGGTASNSSNLDIHIDFKSQSSSSSSPDSEGVEEDIDQMSSDFTVNGQSITVPSNGRLRQKVKSSDGSATLNINISNTGSSNQTGGSGN